MKVSRNPKVKNKLKADILGRMMKLNAEHLGLLLHTLHELYPADWYPKRIREFIGNFQDTVMYFNSGNDDDLMKARIAKSLEDVPYLSYERVGSAYRTLIGRAHTHIDRTIYHEKNFADNYIENMLLMLLTLHYDHGYGAKRIGAVLRAWPSDRYADPFGWLDEYADAQFADSKDDSYETLDYVESLIKERRRGVKVSLQEEMEARHKLEALRAYQERTMAHEKP